MTTALPRHAPHAAAIQAALKHHYAGRLGEAGALYRQVLAAAPDHPDALHLLGMVTFQQGDNAGAMKLVEQAMALDPSEPYYRHDYGDILRAQDRIDDAIDCYRKAIALKPDLVEAHANLGLLLERQGKPELALSSYDAALALAPRSVETLFNAGNAEKALGRLPAAAARFRAAVALAPQHASALYNLGAVLQLDGKVDEALAAYQQLLAVAPDFAAARFNAATLLESAGRADEAIAAYRATLAQLPTLAEAHNNLANLLQARGATGEALAGYREAVALKPDYADAHNNLGSVLFAMGRGDEAVAHFRHALALRDAPPYRANVARCLATLSFAAADDDLVALLTRAFVEAWGRPADLAAAAVRVLRRDHDFAACIDRAVAAWPARPAFDALCPTGLPTAVDGRLYRALMTTTPVADAALEKFLTLARAALPQVVGARGVDDRLLTFVAGLAQQCFLNDYVFDVPPDEERRAVAAREQLAQALAEGRDIAPVDLALVACYVPLVALERGPGLATRPWPPAIAALVTQQVTAPHEEAALAAALPALTTIDDAVSKAVQGQYEEHPYPHWIVPAPTPAMPSLDAWLRRLLPGAPLVPLGDDGALDILVAGCGTGRHAIETAQRFPHARVLAIDLSRASLGYALRKARELGVANLDFAQADLLHLGDIGRTFDVVEAVGVLHHLANPLDGWRTLRSVLRPRGCLRLGLYGERARAALAAGRAAIAEHGLPPTAAGIRRLRALALAAPEGSALFALTMLRDFYSVSECRDMLFHVAEHRTTIPAIGQRIRDVGVSFLGFEVSPAVGAGYASRFPDDPARTNLAHWNAYEESSPRAFPGMYEFWVQQPA